jgi:hypothetical protein
MISTARLPWVLEIRRRARLAAAVWHYVRDTLGLLAASAVMGRDPERYRRIWDLT